MDCCRLKWTFVVIIWNENPHENLHENLLEISKNNLYILNIWDLSYDLYNKTDICTGKG